MKNLVRIFIALIVICIFVFINLLIDILSKGFISTGIIKYFSVFITITLSVLTWNYIDNIVKRRMKK